MFLKDETHPTPDPHGATSELVEDHKEGRLRLIEQARELERLRRQVRSSAEREAAAIVTNARRNVRQVLLDARRELLVLVAQLQAVGCDAPSPGPRDIEGHATSEALPPASNYSTDMDAPRASGATDIVNDARRDVREVLLEAQTELVALAEEARELRARIARQQAMPQPVVAPVAAADVAEPVKEVPRPQQAAGFPVQEPVTQFPSEQLRSGTASSMPGWPSEEPAEKTDNREQVPEAAAAAEHTPLSSGPRVWIAVAAAVVFAGVGLAIFLMTSGRTGSSAAASARSTAAATDQARTAVEKQTASNPLVPPASSSTPEAAGTTGSLAARMEVRRPVWIRTTVDGRPDVGRLYNAGESRTVTAKEEIVLRAGDAGAVLVSLNGTEARPLGLDGRVITRRFGQPAAEPPRPTMAQASARNERDGVVREGGASDVGTTGTEPPPPAAAAHALVEREILRATQQWFEAYFSGNAAGMGVVATPDFSLVDERGTTRRLPATMPGVDRGLQQVRIEVAGDGAVMSARLTERTTVNGQTREYVSLVSGVWIKRDGQWRLTGVRFVDPAAVGGSL